MLMNALKGRSLALSLPGVFKQVCHLRNRTPKLIFGYISYISDLFLFTNIFRRRDKSSLPYLFLSE